MKDKDGRKCPRIKRERDQTVAKNVKKYRTLMSMSQEELAKKLGLTFQQVQKYERGTNRVSAGTTFELSKIFGIPVSWMYYSDDDSEQEANGETPDFTKIEKPLFTDEEVSFIKLLRKANEPMKAGIFGILNSNKAQAKEEN